MVIPLKEIVIIPIYLYTMYQNSNNFINPLDEHFSRVNAGRKQGNNLKYFLFFGIGVLAGVVLTYLLRDESSGIDIEDYLKSEQS